MRYTAPKRGAVFMPTLCLLHAFAGLLADARGDAPLFCATSTDRHGRSNPATSCDERNVFRTNDLPAREYGDALHQERSLPYRRPAARRQHRGPCMTEARRRRILVVEDEMLIAMLVEQMAEDLGYDVVGPAMTIGEALSLIDEQTIDGAVLDMNLGHGVSSAPVAEALVAKGVPFLFASGYGANGAFENVSAAPVLNKPFLTHDLEKALHSILP
jgi:CheY-like chemotaxis protein